VASWLPLVSSPEYGKQTGLFIQSAVPVPMAEINFAEDLGLGKVWKNVIQDWQLIVLSFQEEIQMTWVYADT